MGFRRRKIYVWNKDLKEWDEKEEFMWVKNKQGKEKPLKTKKKEE